MKNTKLNKRFGKVAILLVVSIVVLAIGGYLSFNYRYNAGKELQDKQTQLWNDAFVYFSQKQPERAYLSLLDARSTFCDVLDFYRNYASGTYLTQNEITAALVLVCQSEAYDTLFKLESATDWINKAKAEIDKIEDVDTRNELYNFISRTEEADKFCAKYREYIKTENLPDEKYQELVKESLRVGSKAIESSDYDYTIFEVRFLIACGKSFDEPILISEARKQLFDITTASGEDEKTKLLWGLLRN